MLRMLSRLLVAFALLLGQAQAQSVNFNPGAIAGGACPTGQAMNGLTTLGAPSGCFKAGINSFAVLSPQLASGVTTFTYPLPSTMAGRLRISGVSNGGPGGSGAQGAAGTYRNGGSGGCPGLPFDFEVSISKLASLYAGITALYFDFGALGTPGAAATAGSVSGNNAVAGSSIIFKTNTNGGTIVDQFKPGAAGNGGVYNASSATAATPSGCAASGFSPVLGIGAPAAASGAAGASPAQNLFGPAGAPSGGGLNTSNAETAGGGGVAPLSYPFGVTVPGVAVAEASGAAPTNPYLGDSCLGGVSGSAGGSSNSATVNGGTGGDGGGFGAPGAGGGAGTNGAASGAGGKPQFGCVRIEYILQ